MSENDILLEIVQKEFQQSPRHSRGCGLRLYPSWSKLFYSHVCSFQMFKYLFTLDNSTWSSCSLMDRPREVDNIGYKGKYFMLQWKRCHFELLSGSYSSKYASQEARDKFKKTRMVNYIARL